MALRVELKPKERIILGEVVITNGDCRTRLFVEGKTPILREKDIIRPHEANTPSKKVYLAVQLMYLSKDPTPCRKTYIELIGELIRAAPSTRPFVDAVNGRLLTSDYYKALKEARKLIEHEAHLLRVAGGRA